MVKKALICHYRVGRTDGVSLEITKRANVLKEMGWKVYLLAGTGSDGADFIIPELDFDRTEVRKIATNAFTTLKDYNSQSELIDEITQLASVIEIKLSSIINQINPDMLFVHNIFSHGRHIASALAFYNLIQKTAIPTLATHHDFYWERDDFKAPCCTEIQQFLLKYVPPVLPSLKHAVISSRAADLLFQKSKLNAIVMPDTLDFSMPPWIKDDFNKDFLKTFNLSENDILILQATRIVKRKGIELILPILEKLNDTNYLAQLVGKKIYNGKTITKNSKFVFIIAGYAEQEAEFYFQSIISYLEKKKIPFRNIQHQISAERNNNGNLKKFSIFDTYAYADLVSYPSLYEGWGNQFIEAVFARKPVIAFEYPVFITDIKPKGYEVISLGSKTSFDTKTELLKLPDIIIDETCNKIIETLISKNTTTNLNRNFNIAKSSNSQETLISLMNFVMEEM